MGCFFIGRVRPQRPRAPPPRVTATRSAAPRGYRAFSWRSDHPAPMERITPQALGGSNSARSFGRWQTSRPTSTPPANPVERCPSRRSRAARASELSGSCHVGPAAVEAPISRILLGRAATTGTVTPTSPSSAQARSPCSRTPPPENAPPGRGYFFAILNSIGATREGFAFAYFTSSSEGIYFPLSFRSARTPSLSTLLGSLALFGLPLQKATHS